MVNPLVLRSSSLLILPALQLDMSQLMVFGFFGLGAGRRVSSLKTGTSTKVYHVFYLTTIQQLSTDPCPAEIRIYSPYGDTILPNNTVAFVVAKAHFPVYEPVLLEASSLIPMPGDPSDEAYEVTLPDSPFPHVIGVGHVPSAAITLPGANKSKAFNVDCSDFMRDHVVMSSVQ
jgi:hypothetical protein